MENWQPYGQVKSPSPSPAVPLAAPVEVKQENGLLTNRHDAILGAAPNLEGGHPGGES